MTPIQEAVKAILASGKYSEEDIAIYAQVSKATIRRIKAGKTKKTRPQAAAGIMALYLAIQQNDKMNKKIKTYLKKQRA